MPKTTDPADNVELTLIDGRRIHVHTLIADRVRGLDADSDLLVSLSEADNPDRHESGAEHLIPLTPCCHASGKGAESSTGVICRCCHREVDPKYGGSGTLTVPVAARCQAGRLLTDDGLKRGTDEGVTTCIAVPPVDVAVAYAARALFMRYGQVTGIDFYNGGPRLWLRLHDGTRLVLCREGEDWNLAPADGEDILALTKLFDRDERLDMAVREAVDELWHTACEVVDQLAFQIVAVTAADVVRLLDRATTTSAA